MFSTQFTISPSLMAEYATSLTTFVFFYIVGAFGLLKTLLRT